MKKILLSLSLLTISILLVNCNNDELDLTTDVIGTYVGEFASNTGGSITNYEVRISRISDSRISITPASGSEFSAWETNIERFNESQITSTIGQNDPVVTFGIGSPVTCSFTRSAEGESFVGELQ